MHTPETAGAKALYDRDNGFGYFERAVLGWDKLGRPLVMCGDRLHPAADAPFAHHKKFLCIKRPDFAAILGEAVWDSLRGMREGVEDLDLNQIIRDVVKDAMVRRTGEPVSHSTN